MRTLCWWSLVGAATAALMGCSSSSTPTEPAAAALPSSNDSFAIHTEQGMVVSNAGHFRMRVDVTTMTGEIVPVVDRSASVIGDQYNLPINQFFTAFGGGFELTTVGLDGGGNVVVGYTIQHPFAAPSNLAGPATAANRADLAVTGRVVFLTPAPSGLVDDENSALNQDDYTFTFGAETIVANTKVVKDADGYYDPVDMVNLANFPAQNGANAWPYKVLVNESLNPRKATAGGAAISNGGNEAGNYNAGAGGWQNATIGSNNASWTGYGALHQGQIASNSITFDPDLAEGGSFELDFVAIAKYIDPRGGTTSTEKRANRLPSSDPSKFAYRMPWGAQDVENIGIQSLTLTGGTPGDLVVGVVDYDFGATEDAGFPGAGGTNLDQIPVGTAGLTAIEVASNDLLNANVTVADPNTPNSGVGTYADKLTYNISISNETSTTGGVDGGVWVMVRVEDPEASATITPGPPYAYLYLNDQTTPAPVANPAKPVIYQAAFVTTN